MLSLTLKALAGIPALIALAFGAYAASQNIKAADAPWLFIGGAIAGGVAAFLLQDWRVKRA